MDHQAFAQLLGNYGEFLGAIAVVITLAYLSVQIRQNSRNIEESVRALRLNAADSTVEAFSRFRERISQSDLATLFVKGMDDYLNLSEPEQIQFGAIMDEYMFTYWSVFRRIQEGTYEDADWQAHVEAIRNILIRQGTADWWRERKKVYSPAFVAELASHDL